MSRKIQGGDILLKNMKNNGKTETQAEFFFAAGLLGTSLALYDPVYR